LPEEKCHHAIVEPHPWVFPIAWFYHVLRYNDSAGRAEKLAVRDAGAW